MKNKRKKNPFWKLLFKVLLGSVLAIFLTLAVVAVVAYYNHTSRQAEEAQYLEAPGELVDVDGHKIHVLRQGNEAAEYTLVFLHSNKYIDDSITLQPLFQELSDYDLVYIDRSGFGFSDDYNAAKDISSMVEETRTALKAVDDKTSYILVATKSAGIEAIYWANQYPEEVEAIIGLEMYFPDQYADLDDNEYCGIGNRILLGLCKIGANRYASDTYPSNDFSLYTDRQMQVRNALTSNGYYTKGMYNEDKELVKNAKAVQAEGWPEDTPMYLLYANPFLDPYYSESERMQDLNAELEEQGEEYDGAESYNSYYKSYFENMEQVTMEEISGPERLITYNPEGLAEKIQGYVEGLD